MCCFLVGGASYNEWRKASERNAAQAFGDKILAGIDANDQGASLLAIETATPGQAALVGHMAAADALSSGNPATGLEALDALRNNSEIEPVYRDLAAFKAALALPEDTSDDDRIAAFDALSAPGAPFRTLAQEQKALILISQGKQDEALNILRALIDEAGLTPGLQRRAAELIVSLGGALEDG